MPASPFTLDPDDERRLAVTLFNHTWRLMERTDRSALEDDEILHSTHASRAHWGVVGEPMHWARGEWQCARVYAVLGRAEPALHRRVSLRAARDATEREYLEDLVRATDWDLDQAATIAEVHRKSLERLLREHRIKRRT